MSKSVSIIIPVFNVAPYITDCLQSVMRQTYAGDIECLVVDDCGDDNSIEIANELLSHYSGPISFKVLHHDCNRGLSAARNTGMKASNGDYLYFLDSDDWISDDCIEQLALPLEEKEYDIVVGDYDQTSSSYVHLPLYAEEGPHYSKGLIFDIVCNKGVYVMAVNKLYNRHFLIENDLHFEEGRINEDDIFSFDLACTLKSLFVVKTITYHYRIRTDSIMGCSMRDKNKRISACLGIYDAIKDRVKNRYYDKEGIFDFYLQRIRVIFRWIKELDLDLNQVKCIQKHFSDYLEVIPGVRYLSNKHNRLVYFICKSDPSFDRYWYVNNVYSNKNAGRLWRNVLNLLPIKK